VPVDDPAEAPGATIRVMSFNLWHGGDAGGQPIEQSARVIRAARPDAVGLQETHGLPPSVTPDARGRQADGRHELQIEVERPDRAAQLASLLGWNHCDQGERRTILSPHRLSDPTPQRWGVRVNPGSGAAFYLFNAHLRYRPYQPYQVLHIAYEDDPFLDSEAELVAAARSARAAQVESLLDDVRRAKSTGLACFLTGDFNEPSHQDWTEAAARAGRCPIKVEFPSTKRLTDAGLIDVYRRLYPDEVRWPGYTWTPTRAEDDPGDHPDRLDFIFTAPQGAIPRQIEIVGEDRAHADLIVSPYPSDHRALVATFALTGDRPAVAHRD
jgi:endonuclease/exonuclease/phosphatase family metal-dependent hydrolase